jgi:hypothetical protein
MVKVSVFFVLKQKVFLPFFLYSQAAFMPKKEAKKNLPVAAEKVLKFSDEYH